MSLLLALAVACAPAGGTPRPTAPPDPGADARAQVLARQAATADHDVVPDLRGATPAGARTALRAAGLELDLVPFDRTEPVAWQIPDAGTSLPRGEAVQAWLGLPPPPARPTAPPSPATGATASSSPTPTPSPSPAPTASTTASATATTRYVLPPHGEGLVRINPRRLPALPRGTELTGLASWYGPGFHGLTTACGGTFDANGPTLASRELRCGTIVRITGPSGLTVEATVTDWGPAEWTGRRFDLSAAVFNAIAPLGAGVIPVRVVTVNVPA